MRRRGEGESIEMPARLRTPPADPARRQAWQRERLAWAAENGVNRVDVIREHRHLHLGLGDACTCLWCKGGRRLRPLP